MERPRPFRLRPGDLLWVLAAPIYLLAGTLRHEASHALAGIALGDRLTEFVFWPTGVGWGYVNFAGDPGWPALAAPYVVDVAVAVIGAWACSRIPERLHALWANVLIVAVASPAVDSFYNYARFMYPPTDVARLMAVLGPAIVHAWFVVSAVVFVASGWRSIRGGHA